MSLLFSNRLAYFPRSFACIIISSFSHDFYGLAYLQTLTTVIISYVPVLQFPSSSALGAKESVTTHFFFFFFPLLLVFCNCTEVLLEKPGFSQRFSQRFSHNLYSQEIWYLLPLLFLLIMYPWSWFKKKLLYQRQVLRKTGAYLHSPHLS